MVCETTCCAAFASGIKNLFNNSILLQSEYNPEHAVVQSNRTGICHLFFIYSVGISMLFITLLDVQLH